MRGARLMHLGFLPCLRALPDLQTGADAGWPPASRVVRMCTCRPARFVSLRLLYLIMIRVFGWLLLLDR